MYEKKMELNQILQNIALFCKKKITEEITDATTLKQ